MRSPHLLCEKSFLQKPFVKELAEVERICTSHVTALRGAYAVIRGFGLCVQVVGLPKSATFNNLPETQILNPPLGRGEDGLGRHFVPLPPHQGILLFCLNLLSYLTSGVFFRCKLSLLKQHIFLISTQPSWDGYLLLYCPKSSIRGTIIFCQELWYSVEKYSHSFLKYIFAIWE